jgi:RNA polymerase sigma-70 factor, ECF subfamily
MDAFVPALRHRVLLATSDTSAFHTKLARAMGLYAQGDGAAFLEVHRIARPYVRSFLLRLCGRRELAEELTQDVFVRMHCARGNYTTGAPVLPWAFAIARNALIDYSRRTRVRAPLNKDVQLARESDYAAGPASQADAAVTARETATIVERTLARLPESQREAFVLLRFEGLSVADAAQLVGATEGAIKIRAFRASEAIRAALDAPGGDEGELL